MNRLGFRAGLFFAAVIAWMTTAAGRPGQPLPAERPEVLGRVEFVNRRVDTFAVGDRIDTDRPGGNGLDGFGFGVERFSPFLNPHALAVCVLY